MNHIAKLIRFQWERIVRSYCNEFPESKILSKISFTIAKIWRSATQRVMSLTLMGMLLGLAVDVLIAAKLGTAETADALIVALSLPLFINTVMRHGTKHSILPLFIERRTTLSQVDYDRFVSGLINFVFVLGLAILLFVEVIAPWVVAGLAPGLPPQAREEAVVLLRVSCPMIVLAMGTLLLSVLLNSQKLFSLVALRNSVVPGIVVMIMALVWRGDNIALWVAVAHVIGFTVFFMALFFGGQRAGYKHQWSVRASKADLIALWRAASLPTLAIFVRNGLRIIERVLASLVTVGGVSAYYFAFRIMSGTQTLIGGSILTTSLPTLIEDELAGDKRRLAANLGKSIVRSLILSLPASLIIFLFHADIVRWVYGRGFFDKTSIQQTSQIFFWLGIGLPFSCLVPVLQSGLYAQKAYGMLLRNVLTVAGINIVLAWSLSKVWGLAGIAAAASLSVVISTGNLVRLLNETGVFIVKRSGIASEDGHAEHQ
jgi:murein biosynthesis integral membrane protein MurJ